MMEHTEVVKQEIGYRFRYSVSKETRMPSQADSKTPDKEIVEVTIEGHEPTKERALDALKSAESEVQNILEVKK